MSAPQVLTISQLGQRIGQTLMSAPYLQNQWVVGEISGLQVKGGHCYFELVEKGADSYRDTVVAKVRATIWGSSLQYLGKKFTYESGGQQLSNELKVMMLVNTTYHSIFGLSVNVLDINGAYSAGAVLQRRNEMVRRLQQAGLLEMNRRLPMPLVPYRIAIISARGAAGYGDFIKQLCDNNTHCQRFVIKLFEATMQGQRTAATVIDALERIRQQRDLWDCVAIIRGGGAQTDLLGFDDYELAEHVARFPLPVIIGIGHERDITLLDYVGHTRVKTPTAAADWLLSQGTKLLGDLKQRATAILQAVTDRLGGCHRQLATMAGQLPAAATATVNRARARLDQARVVVAGVADSRLRPERLRLDNYATNLRQALDVAITRERCRLDGDAKLVEVLSPQATLARGYTITRIDGHAVKSVADVPQGAIIETILADGTVLSEKIKDKK